MPKSSKMLNLLVTKVSKDPEYFAWYFNEYMDSEKKSLKDLLEQLRIDEEGFYNLALCKTPNTSAPEFSTKIKKVAEFANINVFPLLQIVRCVDNTKAFRNNHESLNTLLMAARDKDQPGEFIKDE
jgi:hypothetical protein